MEDSSIPPLLATLAAGRPLVLDAAMGTRLIGLGLDLRTDDPALWVLTHPEAVADVHARDAAAGADVLVTDTFGANPAWLARFGRAHAMAEINRRAVELARTAGPGRFILGSIGPTAAGTPDGYARQAEALAEAGVDGLLLETHDEAGALAGLTALGRSSGPPILVSLYEIPREPRRLIDLGAAVLGVNCVRPERALAWVEAVGEVSVPLLFQPAGMHDGEPANWSFDVAALLRRGVCLLGGCCGATEDHVAALRTALDLATARGV